ncbi:Multidrug transporter AcrB [Gammaproteobacteria bacterium]
MNKPLSISGRIAEAFQNSEITPLLALVGLLLGVFGVLVTPQEEEPQISVTFANVFIPFPGASAAEVEQVVATQAEQVLSEVEGVKHVYSVSRPGMAVLTVQYEVGENRTAAILRLYNAIFSNQDFLPRNLGVGQPLVKPKGIDDVPIVTFTLWSTQPKIGQYELSQVAHTLEAELKRIPGTRNVYTIGSQDQVVRVILDPEKLAGYRLALDDLQRALQSANTATHAGDSVADNAAIPIQAGIFLSDAEEVADLVVGMHEGRPVRLGDVAQVSLGPDTPKNLVWMEFGSTEHSAVEDKAHEAKAEAKPERGRFPAVTLAVAKKPGVNASGLTAKVIERMDQMRGFAIPDGVEYTLTRDYGATAKAKANKLIGKLIFATSFVVLLVLVSMGWREALIVGAAVTLTLALTLFANWAWGFTLNRVSLFALIFSIGILVDDAIVVVENVHRHMHLSRKPLLAIIPEAVDEIGGPTILATFTVIAALLPMAFVTGLMGPYMSPIPINASTGMVISLIIAFVVTPWLCHMGLKGVHARLAAAHAEEGGEEHGHGGGEEVSARLLAFFHRFYRPFVTHSRASLNRLLLGVAMLVLVGGSVALVAGQQVVLKMLPFDNKSEFQVVVDMPEGTPLQQTAMVMDALGAYLATVPEVTHYQAYVGNGSPTGFNGLVRQYYLRNQPYLGDIQVNLVDSHHRKRKSHEIARSVRDPLQEIGRRYQANVKIVEVPPGPPVQSPLVAEVYGPDYASQLRVAEKIRQVFAATPDIVDIDITSEHDATRLLVWVDRQRAAQLGIPAQAVSDTVMGLLSGLDASFLHTAKVKVPIPIRLELSDADKGDPERILAVKTHSQSGALVPLSEFAQSRRDTWEKSIYHKDLMRVVYVTGDMAGKLDSPLYGMVDLNKRLAALNVEDGLPITQQFIKQPEHYQDYTIKWDGEWQVTYETFRDMGIAYSVGLLMIYLLVVGQFRSYVTPLVIMAPIPLTIIGVMPGHALMAAQFTATSMIGMIALAGIIVRNSILLVDFINQEVARGIPLAEAVTLAGAVRSKPIALTGLAAMLGALFILDDPIFGGLAISLIFGIFISTLLTLWVIPILYFAVKRKQMA